MRDSVSSRPFATRHRHRKTKWSWRAWFVARSAACIASKERVKGTPNPWPQAENSSNAYAYQQTRTLVLDQLFGATVEEADMGINPLNDLAVKFQHEPQDPVCCRMHRPKIDGEVALGHLRVGDPTVKSGKLPARSTTISLDLCARRRAFLGKIPAIRGKTARQKGDVALPRRPRSRAAAPYSPLR